MEHLENHTANDLKVRSPQLTLPETLSLMPDSQDRYYSAFTAALTFIAPNIERFLIKAMAQARAELADDCESTKALKEELLLFSSQEASHSKAHEKLNKKLLSALDEKVRNQVLALDDQLATDYRNFLENKSLLFNLAYAEGFEALTCATAFWAFEEETFTHMEPGWLALIEWHLAEEVEHRAVAYNIYHAMGVAMYTDWRYLLMHKIICLIT